MIWTKHLLPCNMVHKLLFRGVKLRFLNVSSEGRAWKDNGNLDNYPSLILKSHLKICFLLCLSWLMNLQFPEQSGHQK